MKKQDFTPSPSFQAASRASRSPPQGGSASTGESAKAAANTGGSSGGAVTVKVSLSQAATEPPVKAAEYFKEIVEERSNGEIKVEIYPERLS